MIIKLKSIWQAYDVSSTFRWNHSIVHNCSLNQIEKIWYASVSVQTWNQVKCHMFNRSHRNRCRHYHQTRLPPASALPLRWRWVTVRLAYPKGRDLGLPTAFSTSRLAGEHPANKSRLETCPDWWVIDSLIEHMGKLSVNFLLIASSNNRASAYHLKHTEVFPVNRIFIYSQNSGFRSHGRCGFDHGRRHGDRGYGGWCYWRRNRNIRWKGRLKLKVISERKSLGFHCNIKKENIKKGSTSTCWKMIILASQLASMDWLIGPADVELVLLLQHLLLTH